MKQAAKFISGRLKSISYAAKGIHAFLSTETHAVVHAAATAVVVAACFFFPVSAKEIIALLIVTGMVWVAELLNTAIEKMMNFLSPQKSTEVKFIKDVAAGAVLLAALTAILVGGIIFIPKI